MRAKTQNMVFLVVLVVLAAGGYFLHTLAQKNLREELTDQRMRVEAELKKVQRAGVEAKALADAKRSEARKAEADLKRAEAEKEKANAAADAARDEKENLAERMKVAAEETERAEKSAEAAVAEQKRLEAEKAASEAKEKEIAAQRAKDEVALELATKEREKAQDEKDRAIAEQKTAEAAKVKSENELRAAEKNAVARRDERLLMYKRGGTSEAERKEVAHAEKLLKAMEAWEAGQLTAENLAAVGAQTTEENAGDTTEPASEEEAALAEAKKDAMKGKRPDEKPDPCDERLKGLLDARDNQMQEMRKRREAESVKALEPLLRAAEQEGRTRDAEYYRRVLQSLVPGYSG